MRALASVVLLVGCGDNAQVPAQPDAGSEARCTQAFSNHAPAGCAAAQIFAARDSAGLVPTQSEIDRYLERWVRVIDREPILTNRIPLTYREQPPSTLDIMTTNAAVIAAWRTQQIATGDPDFDAAIAPLEPRELNAFYSNPGGPGGGFLFSIDVAKIYNEEELERELAQAHANLPPPFHAPRDDGQWVWIAGPTGDLDTARITFGIGFGTDCLVGCPPSRYLEATVPPTGPATVYDLGGDPLPAGVQLSPTTLPPPWWDPR